MYTTVEQIETFFQSRKTFGIKPGLERMRFLLNELGNPEDKLQIVHVAGTNGKGSTVTFMQNILQQSEYRIGQFSSPSFTGYRGHFMINDQEISDENFIQLFAKTKNAVDKLDELGQHPTEFEIITAMALLYFVGRTDIVMFEAGMGGKEDTTNVVTPILSIITTIAMDHTQFLGDTIEEITEHKAGIIKINCPVVTGDLSETSLKIAQHEARMKNAEHYMYNRDYQIKNYMNNKFFIANGEEIPLRETFTETYQLHNFAVGFMSLIILEKLGYSFDREKARKLMDNFQVAGRLEKIKENPLIILDSAHNVAGIKALTKTMNKMYPTHQIHCLFAAFRDKAIKEMVEQLQISFSHVILTSFEHERATTIAQLKDYHFPPITYMDDWRSYLDQISSKEQNDIYVITGSMHFIMQVRNYLT